jgi:hypothetical protein
VSAARVKAPDGRTWEVRAFRVRLPPWRTVDVSTDEDDSDLFSIVIFLVAAPFSLLLIPLAAALVELPVAVVRGLFSSTAWVEAASHYPREERVLWRTSRTDAAAVRAEVAAQLSSGTQPRPARAEFVEHTDDAAYY